MHSQMKLGKKPVVHDPRTLRLAKYLDTTALPPPPAAVDYSVAVPLWPMYANDRHGDCTCVTAGHMIGLWSFLISGTEKIFTDDEILALYALVNGGVDEGANELEVLKTWRTTGLAGNKIEAFASINPADTTMVKLAAFLFCGLYIGAALPLSAQHQQVWDVVDDSTGAPGSWGGHAINVVAYDATGVTVVTWGQLKKATWAWWLKYVDEAYVLFPSEFEALPVGGIKGVGLNVDQLRVDLAQVGAVLP